MPNKIDTIGNYRGEIMEAGLGVTKNQFPQSVLRLKALEKWVDSKSEMEHFKLPEPAWVDWSSFEEETVGFFVLFNSADTFDKGTSLLNYEQLQMATGWDGLEFDSLQNGALLGKKVSFRVEDHEYQGKQSIQVSWIDAYNADPVRKLKTLDAEDVKALNKKLKIAKPAAKPVAAKPTATKPAAAPAPEKKPDPTPTVGETASTAATSASVTPEKPAAPKPKAKKSAPPPPSPVKDESTADTSALPKECDKMAAWEFVCEHKGDNSDTDVEEAWISACTEIGGTKDEDKFIDSDWAKVRNVVIKDMALTI